MTSLRTSTRTGLVTLAAAAIALSSPAAAAGQEAQDLMVQPSTVQDGGSIQVSGRCTGGAAGEEEVAVFAGGGFEGGLLGRVAIAADGSFDGSVTIPQGSPAASGEISVPCPDGTTVLTASLTIQGPEPQPIGEVPSGQVPSGGVPAGGGGGEGVDPAVLGLGGAGAVLVAAGTAVAVRRRMP